MKLISLIKRVWDRHGIKRQLIVCKGDTPPNNLKSRDLYLAREDDENWAIALNCPCGCGDRIELQLIPELSPNWRLVSNNQKFPTLHPSIWRTTGCKSHFWVKKGHIHWCLP